ncbi:arginine--tRNA ligase [Spirilliplanes yamanashiensis]|uniref:Arginine--tRNA ligase n=1 Tax=Spirilliplanes yamanashiensis TaxID=42233 RepID=A0A8J4DI52_9ACTN|nr:arginine--tRNA ligase [Spirilliplanes yamanashiensis]MDP9814772.1 arginyl-tRNA synthetase [Spirilliplanes yamanashiensis]GIJ02426.1 arginine--tRNA ligase [Spirilliplanes yamanashiensis]
MSVPSIAESFDRALRAAVPGLVEPAVRSSGRADLQADGLLALARRRGEDPQRLAGVVAGRIPGAVAAGPGFVNLTVPEDVLRGQVALRLADGRLGVGLPEAGTTTVVDYSQPNIAKEMHVGHLRSTIIGDALVRVLEHLGGTVLRQNHIGDWGTQFGMLIQFLHERGDGDYRAARALFEADTAFAERSRRRVVALQAGDPASVAVWRRLVAASFEHFTDVYDRLGVRLRPADAVGESFYNAALPQVAADLEAAGVAVVSDGALCVFGEEASPLIVRKSDGGFGYAATDLAALRHRVGVLGADRILYVVDARQALHFRQVFAAARRAGWLGGQAVHVPFGTVLGDDGRPFRTRSGETVRLTDLLDAAVAAARDVVSAKNPGLGGEELAERARQVGIGAVKYADLSTGRTRDYVFDVDRMVALTGDTGVYVQFAHARLRSILRRAGATPAVTPVALEPVERRLILRLDGFAAALGEVAAGYEPHRLCGYLSGLAQAVTAFVETCPVLRAPADVRANRLALCTLAADTLRTGLDLLGVATPDRL